MSAGGTYPPACIVGTSVSSESQVKQKALTNMDATNKPLKINKIGQRLTKLQLVTKGMFYLDSE